MHNVFCIVIKLHGRPLVSHTNAGRNDKIRIEKKWHRPIIIIIIIPQKRYGPWLIIFVSLISTAWARLLPIPLLSRSSVSLLTHTHYARFERARVYFICQNQCQSLRAPVCTYTRTRVYCCSVSETRPSTKLIPS